MRSDSKMMLHSDSKYFSSDFLTLAYEDPLAFSRHIKHVPYSNTMPAHPKADERAPSHHDSHHRFGRGQGSFQVAVFEAHGRPAGTANASHSKAMQEFHVDPPGWHAKESLVKEIGLQRIGYSGGTMSNLDRIGGLPGTAPSTSDIGQIAVLLVLAGVCALFGAHVRRNAAQR